MLRKMPVHAVVSRTVVVVCPCGCGCRFPVKVQVPIRGSLELADAEDIGPEALTGGLRGEATWQEVVLGPEPAKAILPGAMGVPRPAPLSGSGSANANGSSRTEPGGSFGRSSSGRANSVPWQERARRKLRPAS